jgi:hypothetical protein
MHNRHCLTSTFIHRSLQLKIYKRTAVNYARLKPATVLKCAKMCLYKSYFGNDRSRRIQSSYTNLMITDHSSYFKKVKQSTNKLFPPAMQSTLIRKRFLRHKIKGSKSKQPSPAINYFTGSHLLNPNIWHCDALDKILSQAAKKEPLILSVSGLILSVSGLRFLPLIKLARKYFE